MAPIKLNLIEEYRNRNIIPVLYGVRNHKLRTFEGMQYHMKIISKSAIG